MGDMILRLPDIVRSRYKIESCDAWKDNKPSRCAADARNDFISVYKPANDYHSRYLYKTLEGVQCVHVLNIFSDYGRPILSSGNGFYHGRYDNVLDLTNEDTILDHIARYIAQLKIDYDVTY